MPEGEVPHDQQAAGVEAQPRNRRGDEVSEEEDEERAEELAEVGAADDELCPGGVVEVALREEGGDVVLEVAVGVEGEGVGGEEPDEFAAGEEDAGACGDGDEEELGGLREEGEVGGAVDGAEFGGCGGVLGGGDEGPDAGGGGEAEGGDDDGHVVAEVGDEHEGGGEGAGGAGDFVKDVHGGVEAAELLHCGMLVGGVSDGTQRTDRRSAQCLAG